MAQLNRGRVSVPAQAALSGSQRKASGFAGGYLPKLRYHIQIDPVTKEEWIEDRQNLAMREWKGSGKLLYSESSTDFALVTRVLYHDTGNWILAAGGLGMHGTEAAGDLGCGRLIPGGLLHGESDNARTRHLVSLRPASASAATASA